MTDLDKRIAHAVDAALVHALVKLSIAGAIAYLFFKLFR